MKRPARSFSVSMGAILLLVTVLAAKPQGPTPAPPAGSQPASGSTGVPRGAGAGGQGRGGAPTPDFSPRPAILPLSPDEQATKFWLQPGFRMEPVLAEPAMQEPGQIAFDGNGRMYVIELRTYMQDVDGTSTLAPDSRISVHEDRDNDGRYETSRVFVDALVFPRFVMPLGDGVVLTKESNADEVWKFSDTDGDGVADLKELFATGMGRVANVEHQESGLMWALDNWIYSSVNPVRLRITKSGAPLREPTGANGGAWGVTQDNHGKLWFQVGATGLPNAFQIPVLYGDLQFAQQFEPEMDITWGAPVRVADMQGGMGSVRMPDGSLMRVTAGAGNDIYRGDRLPTDLVGDYFHGEVVARIVRRLRPTKTDGLTRLSNIHAPSEFIRSIDPLFRPVDMTTAPDGTMYITDMYRGIIQESQWSGPGTYLRNRINQYGLDKVAKLGRIWRLTYDGMPRRMDQPRMGTETAAQLVARLSDPNGWWRDTAQQLLVLKQDKSVAPALVQMAQGNRVSSSASENPVSLYARIHALWTLEGLGALDRSLAQQLMKDADPQMRLQAMRASETLYKAGDKALAGDWKALAEDADPDVVMQAIMTLRTLKAADANSVVKTVLDGNKAKGPQLVANLMLNPPAAGRGSILEAVAAYSPEEQQSIEKGETVYKELCFSCHGDDGRGEPNPGTSGTKAPALASSPRVLGHHDYVIKTLLHGLTGPVAGTTYTEVMIPMGQNNDEWVAAVGSYIRNAFGNRAPPIQTGDVARVRAATKARRTLWNTAELEASLPRQLAADPNWKLTASHNPAIASYALSIQPWTSGQAQAPGMWLQVELPQPVMITEIQFESSSAAINTGPIVAGAPPRTNVGGGGGGRGGAAGGRGAAPGAAPAAGAAAPAPAPAPAAPAPPPLPIGYPRGYQVLTSLDGVTWGRPIAQGAGTGTSTHITFTPVRAKFVRLAFTAAAPEVPVTIQKLRLYEPGSATTR